MIRRLRLRSWRAFDDLDITLDEGVTFIVAENGVGKTSLLEAASWALYGHRSRIDAESARRKNTDGPASAAVDVELPDGRLLQVKRTTAGKKGTLDVQLDGSVHPGEALDELLSSAFAADLDYLARVTVLPTDVLRSYVDEVFHLRRHLCHVFGVDALEGSLEHIKRYATQAASATKRFRSDLESQIVDETRLLERVAALEADAAQRTSDREALAAEFAHLDAIVTAAATADQARLANKARSEALEALTARAHAELAIVEAPDADLGSALQGAESETVELIDGQRRELSVTNGRLDAIAAALSELEDAGAECPVCRRPLEAEDAEHARDAHAADAAALSELARSLEARIDAASVRLQFIRTLQRDFQRLPAPQPVPPETVSLEQVAERRQRVQERMTELSEQVGAGRAEHGQLTAQIAASREAQAEQAKATQLFRREAFATAAQAAVEATIRTVLATRVEPVAVEVTSRWKRIFGERGLLQLTPDGELKLVRGGYEIPFPDFSAGEKVVSLLTARLLIVSASTKASFMWLDEPLEHLDPSNRRIVASLLATAAGSVRQVLVTTYEEPLARRLVEQVPSVHLTYIRTVDA